MSPGQLSTVREEKRRVSISNPLQAEGERERYRGGDRRVRVKAEACDNTYTADNRTFKHQEGGGDGKQSAHQINMLCVTI